VRLRPALRAPLAAVVLLLLIPGTRRVVLGLIGYLLAAVAGLALVFLICAFTSRSR